jgi:hypothetical protein
MRFVFHIGADGRLAVTGSAPDATTRQTYRRVGTYRLDGDRFVTPVLNEGQPVLLRMAGRELILTVNDELRFRLWRE